MTGMGVTAMVITIVVIMATWTDPRTNATSQAPQPDRPNVHCEIPSYAAISVIILIGVAIAAAVTSFLYRGKLLREQFRAELVRTEREQDAIESAIDRLREKMSLPSLVELNRLMLDKYHEIATNQAERSFRSSQRAMWYGFAGLACFSVGFTLPSRQATILLGSFA